jgi:hypothetical protein
MHKSLMIPLTLAVAFGLAVFAGHRGAASAAPAGPVLDEASALGTELDTVLLGRSGAEPRHWPILRCLRAAVAVAKACPCQGPDADNNGEPDGWASHEAYVECVTAKVAELAAGERPPSERCLTRIVEWAERSPIGTEGFECPTFPRHPRPPTPTPTAAPAG